MPGVNREHVKTTCLGSIDVFYHTARLLTVMESVNTQHGNDLL